MNTIDLKSNNSSQFNEYKLQCSSYSGGKKQFWWFYMMTKENTDDYMVKRI